MADDILSLSGEFEGNDEAAWRALAEAALKGRPPESLNRKTLDGLTVPALARETDFASATDPFGAPGAAPFIRGGSDARDPHLPWDIRQAFTHPDPATTNAEILRDLMRGVSSVELVIDPTGASGVAIATEEDMTRALNGVIPTIAPVSLSFAGAAGTGLESAAQLALWAEGQDTPREARLAFNLDPVGALMRTGLIEGGIDHAMRETATVSEALSLRFPKATIFRADARAVHEAGGGAVIELAALIASTIDSMRRLSERGIKPEAFAATVTLGLAVRPDYFREIAKLRAARLLWARCLEALDIPAQPARLHAVTSARMMTRSDPWVNMLRATAATFAAGVGGADIVTTLPFTYALGVPEELARRVARNTQVIAQAESHLGRVADPAGGAWVIEKHASDLAEAAWKLFQDIEREGGMVAALTSGTVQKRVAADRAELRKQVATRRMPLTGTSSYPTLDEVAPPVAERVRTTPDAAVSSSALDRLLPGRAKPADTPTEADLLWPIRLSEPFDRLRERAAAMDPAPVIHLAALGSEAEHAARVEFARHLFASGGLALSADANSARTPVALICGTDEAYAEQAAATARDLKAKGFARIFLAGRPGDLEAPLREAGVTDFIFMGCNAVDALERALAELGVADLSPTEA